MLTLVKVITVDIHSPQYEAFFFLKLALPLSLTFYLDLYVNLGEGDHCGHPLATVCGLLLLDLGLAFFLDLDLNLDLNLDPGAGDHGGHPLAPV